MGELFNYRLGFNELSSKEDRLHRALLAEFLATFMLNLFGCMVATHGTHTMISLTFGFVVFAGIMAVGHISGGHMNPTVTLAVLSIGHISFVRAILYIVVQCAGAIAGSCCLKAILPEPLQGRLGITTLHPDVTPLQGVAIEFFLGFVLMIVIVAVCADKNRNDTKYAKALAITFTVVFAHMTGIKFTGASVNGARSLGSAVAAGVYDNLWVYWVGPPLGGICAALLYTQAFAEPTPRYDVSDRYRAVATEKEMVRLESKREMA